VKAVTPVVETPSVAHGEGHLVLVADHSPGPAPTLTAIKDLGGTARLERFAEWAGLALVGAATAGALAPSVRRRLARR
jgi:hypothetical protein